MRHDACGQPDYYHACGCIQAIDTGYNYRWMRVLGSGETEPTPKGSGERESAALRSGETETTSLRSGETEPSPKGSGEIF